MIIGPSQWQIDNVREHDKIVVARKSLVMRIIDLISGFKPELVTVKMKSKDNMIYKKQVDKRLVTIFTQEEINSKITSRFNYTVINRSGLLSDVRSGNMIVSINQLNLSLDNKIYSIPIDVIEQCIERCKRRYNMLGDDDSSLDYDYVSESEAKEFEYNGYKYEFNNGINFKIIMYKLKNESDKSKDKYMIIENLFKLSASGNSIKDVTDKLLEVLSDRINLALSESNDRKYNSFLLEETLDNVIKKYVKVTKVKEES